MKVIPLYDRVLLRRLEEQEVKKGGIMHDAYQKLIGNGMHKNKALVAIAKKLLILMFAMVRDDVGYIKNYHKLYPKNLKKVA